MADNALLNNGTAAVTSTAPADAVALDVKQPLETAKAEAVEVRAAFQVSLSFVFAGISARAMQWAWRMGR